MESKNREISEKLNVKSGKFVEITKSADELERFISFNYHFCYEFSLNANTLFRFNIPFYNNSNLSSTLSQMHIR